MVRLLPAALTALVASLALISPVPLAHSAPPQRPPLREPPFEVAKERLDSSAKTAPANRANSKVVGGKVAGPGQFPWQVALIRADAPANEPYRGFFCGGTLVKWKWILTAAHCTYETSGDTYRELSPNSINIIIGTENFRGGQRIAARRIVRGQFDFQTQDNDIALIELSEEPTHSGGLAPVSLADVAGSRAFVVGWGSTQRGILPDGQRTAEEKLRFADVVFKDSFKCNSYHLDFNRAEARRTLRMRGQADKDIETLVDSWYPLGSQQITGQMLCAGSDSGARDACFGDSGGPLLVAKGDGYAQVGIVSWGPSGGCGLSNLFGVYTRLSAFSSWIDQVAH